MDKLVALKARDKDRCNKITLEGVDGVSDFTYGKRRTVPDWNFDSHERSV